MHRSDLTTSLIGLWAVYLGVMGLLTTRPDAFAQIGGWISLVTIVLMGFVWVINRENKSNHDTSANESNISRTGGSRFGGNSPRFGSSDSTPPSRFGGTGTGNSSGGFGSGQRPNPFGGGTPSQRFGTPFGSKPAPFGKPSDDSKDDDKKEGDNPRDNLLNRLSKLGGSTDNPFSRADDEEDKPRNSSYFFSLSSRQQKDDEKAKPPENLFGARPKKQEKEDEDENPVELPGFFEDAIRDVLKQAGITDDEVSSEIDADKTKPKNDSGEDEPMVSKPTFGYSEDDIYYEDDDAFEFDDAFDYYDDDDDDDDTKASGSKPDDIPF